MKAYNSVLILFVALFFGLSSSLFSAEAQLGTVKLVGVSGDVVIQPSSADSSYVASDGQIITQGYTIKTGPNSSLVLVFSNGVTVYVGPNTVLNIDSFTQTLEGTPVNRPLDEIDTEPGTSKAALHLISGSIVVKADKLNQDSLFTVRDANVQSQVKENAVYSQTTSEAISIVKVESGKVLTKTTGQEQQSERDTGEHLFQNGEHNTTETPVNLAKELDELSKAEQSNSAPNPVTEEEANAIGEGISQLPPAPSTTQPQTEEGEEGEEGGTPPPPPNPNDINNAPDFNNPVTGGSTITDGDNEQDNELLQPDDVFPPTPPTPPGPGPTPPPVSVIE